MSVNYEGLPEHMQEGARSYVEDGIRPGSFLYHVLCNDFADAFVHADPINRECMGAWVAWICGECPSDRMGSKAAVERWIQACFVRRFVDAVVS